MKKFLLITFSFFIIGIGYSQTFEKVIQTNFDSFGQDVLFFQNHYYVLAISKISAGPTDYSSAIYKLDVNGELVDSIHFDFLNKHAYLSKLLLLDGHIFSYGITNEIDTLEQQAIHLKLDLNLGLKFIQITGTDSIPESFRDIIVTADGRLIALYLPGEPYYISEINPLNGSIDLKQAYYNPNYRLVELPAYNLLHCWTSMWDPELISYDSGTYTLIDSVGSPSYLDKRTSGILIDDSSYFIATHTMKFYQQDLTWDFALLRVHKDLYYMDSVIFNTPLSQYHYTAFTRSLDYQQNTTRLFYGGTLNGNNNYYPPNSFIPAPHRFQLLNIERTGSLTSRKVFGVNGEDYADVMFSLAGTPDGGCIMVGSRWDYGLDPNLNQRNIYILKVDSLGNYVPSTGIEKNEEAVSRNIRLYPNPSHNKTIHLSGFRAGDNISIYNLQGKLVKQTSAEATIHIAGIENGLYVVVIKNESGEVVKTEKLAIN